MKRVLVIAIAAAVAMPLAGGVPNVGAAPLGAVSSPSSDFARSNLLVDVQSRRIPAQRLGTGFRGAPTGPRGVARQRPYRWDGPRRLPAQRLGTGFRGAPTGPRGVVRQRPYRWDGPRRYHRGRYYYPYRGDWYYNDGGAWIAAGAIGLAAGALLGAAAAGAVDGPVEYVEPYRDPVRGVVVDGPRCYQGSGDRIECDNR